MGQVYGHSALTHQSSTVKIHVSCEDTLGQFPLAEVLPRMMLPVRNSAWAVSAFLVPIPPSKIRIYIGRGLYYFDALPYICFHQLNLPCYVCYYVFFHSYDKLALPKSICGRNGPSISHRFSTVILIAHWTRHSRRSPIPRV